MSKLAKEIYAVDSGIRKPKSSFEFCDVRSAWANENNLISKKFSVSAKFGADVLVNDDITNSLPIGSLSEAIKAVKLAVIEEVFGEFRAPISELRVALHQQNFDKAIEALSRLESKMFVEGIHD